MCASLTTYRRRSTSVWSSSAPFDHTRRRCAKRIVNGSWLVVVVIDAAVVRHATSAVQTQKARDPCTEVLFIPRETCPWMGIWPECSRKIDDMRGFDTSAGHHAKTARNKKEDTLINEQRSEREGGRESPCFCTCCVPFLRQLSGRVRQHGVSL